jgi:two-component system aerobic respiration control sensor histidine kinase ArcB
LSTVAELAQLADEKTSKINMDGRRVLLIEDNKLLSELVGSGLEELGYLVTRAGTGKEALELFARGGIETVLLDLGLPDWTGIEIAKRIRAQSNEVDVFMLALSGRIDADTRREVHEAGFDGFIPKPFTIQTLDSVISKRFAGIESSKPLEEA